MEEIRRTFFLSLNFLSLFCPSWVFVQTHICTPSERIAHVNAWIQCWVVFLPTTPLEDVCRNVDYKSNRRDYRTLY
ncbi:hypothetical protein BDF14DRAFT_1806799 [Spinellus fusiger]|nr:hypothetical protein BDF14DRAFT_1806799 [Spinellus fusiger]